MKYTQEIPKGMVVKEKTFEDAIIGHLTSYGWRLGSHETYSRELAFDPKAVVEFLKSTQPKQYEQLAAFYRDEIDTRIADRLNRELDLRGSLDVIRHGITDSGVKFQMAYFKPESKLNPETLDLYAKNALTVSRQVRYSLKNENSVDLLLSLNGLPVATVELKNQFTGQDVNNAKRQFRYDRDPRKKTRSFLTLPTTLTQSTNHSNLSMS